jgi:two-component system sensor histidine kinase AgrC
MSLVNIIIASIFYNFFQLKLSFEVFGRKIDLKNKRKVIILIFLIIFMALSTTIFVGLVRSIINIFLVFVGYYFIYEENFNNTFAKVISMTAVFFIAEIICSIILFTIGINFSIEINPNNSKLIMISNILIGLIANLIYSINILRSFVEKFTKSCEKKYFAYVAIIMLFSALIITNIKLFSFSRPEEYVPNLLLVFLFGSIVFFLVKENNDNLVLSKKYEQLFNYLNYYEKEMSKKSMIIHEFKNQLITIKGFNEGKNNELEEYLETVIQDNKTFTETKLLKDMENIPKGGLKGLLYYKLAYLSDEGIIVKTDISKTIKKNLFDNLDPNLYKELMKIVGVLLDNAIEAARESKEKQIIFEIYYSNGKLNIIISNTYKGEVKIDKIFESNYSTKGNGHGYGLALVKKILNDNNCINLENKIATNYFIMHLSIPLKKNTRINLKKKTHKF